MNGTIKTLLAASGNSVGMEGETGRIQVRSENTLRAQGIDALVYLAAFGDPARRTAARWLIWEAAQALGIRPASIHELYAERVHDDLSHPFTTPAINSRAMSYDTARAAFRAAMRGEVGAFMFELSRTEMADTDQRPAEYAAVILAAAIKEGFRGPVFLQGDHFQVHARKYQANPEVELNALRRLIDESIGAGFYNIELDTSGLIDPSRPTPAEQQRAHYELSALLSDYVRARQPPGVTIALGGAAGAADDRNTGARDVRVFMDYYQRLIAPGPGLSKLSVRTGAAHGGVVRPDGSVAPMNVDFALLQELSQVARYEYGLGGVAQHGASTLPEDAFRQFAQAGAIEAHLATSFQNALFEQLPTGLRAEINAWLFEHAAGERKPGDTDAQFLYKTRRRAIGPFKKILWNLPAETRAQIRTELESRFARLFERLCVEHTQGDVSNAVHAPEIHSRIDSLSH